MHEDDFQDGRTGFAEAFAAGVSGDDDVDADLRPSSAPPVDPVLDSPYLPAGADRADTERLVREGLLRRQVADVVVPAHVPDTAATRAAAARVLLAPLLRGPTGALPRRNGSIRGLPVVGFAAAVWVHVGGSPPDRLDIVIAPGSARTRRPALRIHEHRLAERDVHWVTDLPVTEPCRTAVDVARGCPGDVAQPLLDLLHSRAGVRPVDVVERLERMPRARGITGARLVVNGWAAAVASRPGVSLGSSR